MTFITMILRNLIGIDGLILALAAANFFWVLPKVREHSQNLASQLNPAIYLPITQIMKKIGPSQGQINLHQLQFLREKELFHYQLFVSITSIFPLLGILGTVISLLGLIDFQTQKIMINFSAALTSTFWGLVFAILFKAIDARISSQITFNQENFNLLFRRLDEYLEKNPANISATPSGQTDIALFFNAQKDKNL